MCERMLRLLEVRNLALIEHLALELSPDFTALTGETGAGKSIIVDALGLLLGGRADASLVRTGASQLRVEGVFVLEKAQRTSLQLIAAEYGLDDFAEELILSREVSGEGRSTCRVNGRLVPVRVAHAVGEMLVDIHGQGQQHSLLRVAEHVRILDQYAGLSELQETVAGQVRELENVRRDLTALRDGERDAARRADLLQFQADEITEAYLREGEEEELARERSLLANAERLRALADEAYRALTGDEQRESAVDLLGQAGEALSQIEAVDEAMGETRGEAEGALSLAEELARTLREYRDSIEYDPARLEVVEERLAMISQLKRKYGDSITEITEFARVASEELEGLMHSEERTADLEVREKELLGEVGEVAERLSLGRQEAASRLGAAVEGELTELAMEGTQVTVEVGQTESENGVPVAASGGEKSGDVRLLAYSSTGVDQVEFLISPNPGEPLRPLARIASGGETARLMLALKSILTSADQIPTLVFDEIDAGIGGRVGAVVGSKLWGLSREHQVLCVTHLPQIAAYGDFHLRVSKSESAERTLTQVEAVSGEGRVGEISQMLGSPGEAGRRNAADMLAETEGWKRERVEAG